MEQINIKKQNEYKILSKIYNNSSRYIIESCEQPDFVIFDKKTNKKFGVEITELYYSPSSAKFCKRLFRKRDSKKGSKKIK